MKQLELTIQSLRVNPIHNKQELMFVDDDEHYLPAYLEEYQADLIRMAMIEPGSVEGNNIAIEGIDFNIDRLEAVIVDGLKEGALNTTLHVTQRSKHIQVSCPAEKAIALALSKGVPMVMIKE